MNPFYMKIDVFWLTKLEKKLHFIVCDVRMNVSYLRCV